MNVEELIAELKKYPKQTAVKIEKSDSFCTDAGTWIEDTKWVDLEEVVDLERGILLRG